MLLCNFSFSFAASPLSMFPPFLFLFLHLFFRTYLFLFLVMHVCVCVYVHMSAVWAEEGVRDPLQLDWLCAA